MPNSTATERLGSTILKGVRRLRAEEPGIGEDGAGSFSKSLRIWFNIFRPLKGRFKNMSASTKTRRANGTAAKKTAKSRPAAKLNSTGSGRDRAKKKLTADEQLLRAWRKTYDNRHPA
ncbi:MAG: hypothetical protein ACREAC_31490 [Blastocatellia bacterium]